MEAAKVKNRGIILMNLGSPDSTEVKDVARYLNEFLMDERVIDYPWLFRKILINGIIVPRRAPKSAEAYKTIWTKDGSPLINITKAQAKLLEAQMGEPVEISMRYGSPSPKEAYDNLMKRNPEITEVVAVPLYPHYAMSSYETAVEQARLIYQTNKYSFKLRFVPAFYNDEKYIEAFCNSIEPYLQQPHDHILFSYHGIPARHLKKTDVTGHCLGKNFECCNQPSIAHKTCYRHQVFETTRLVAERLNLPKDKYSLSFQSRLGGGWLEPFTDIRLHDMPKEGIKNLIIVSPAFVSDCLETLEELEERGKEEFIGAGGETYKFVPCMNTNPTWINAIEHLVNKDVK
mgnify:FL=1